jgi:hypothetical protein
MEKVDLSTLINSTIALENKVNREIVVRVNEQCPAFYFAPKEAKPSFS